MLCLKLFVLSIVLLNVSGNLVRNSDEINTKVIPVKNPEENEVEEINVSAPDPIDEVALSGEVDDKSKPCTEIGKFCVNHSDCCSNACLGYMRRCVSGSG